MKYYLDQEFIEGFRKPWFGRRRHFVDLISIGIVCEDGRSYFAISNEYNYREANSWVRTNVIHPLQKKMIPEHYDMDEVEFGTPPVHPSNFHQAIGKPIKQIAREVIEFVNPHFANEYILGNDTYCKLHNINRTLDPLTGRCYAQPEFWGYFADYDWVLFCSLFGTMMDLPLGFPMYCRDLKQSIDELAESIPDTLKLSERRIESFIDFDSKLNWIKSLDGYPKNSTEHDAESDAHWNRNLHKFIIKTKNDLKFISSY